MDINHRNHPQPGKIDDLITRLQKADQGAESYDRQEIIGYLLSYRDLLRRAYTESLHKQQLEKFEKDHYE